MYMISNFTAFTINPLTDRHFDSIQRNPSIVDTLGTW